eukprot:SAG25_NODE_1872_length_2224_cov_213.131765_1_plen_724_part_10
MEELCRELGERGKGVERLRADNGKDTVAVSRNFDSVVVALQTTDRNNGLDLLVSSLERGLEVLDSLATATPRQSRKSLDLVCGKVEIALQRMDSELASQLALIESAQLSELCSAAHAVTTLRVDDGEANCIQVVEVVLSCLELCSDKLVSSTRMLESEDAAVRMRGLLVFKEMAHVVLDVPCQAEILAASIAASLASDGVAGRQDKFEQATAAFMAVSTLCLRNGDSTIEAFQSVMQAIQLLWSKLRVGMLVDLNSMRLHLASGYILRFLWSPWGVTVPAIHDLKQQVVTDIADRRIIQIVDFDDDEHSLRRCALRLAEAMCDDDDDMASAAGTFTSLWYRACCLSVAEAHQHLSWPDGLHPVADAFQTPKMATAIVTLFRRVGPRVVGESRKSVLWWDKRCEVACTETLKMFSGLFMLRNCMIYTPILPAFEEARDEAIQEAVYVARMNQAARMSVRPTFGLAWLILVFGIIVEASREKALHSMLSASGLLKSLLYATASDMEFTGIGIAHLAATAAVHMIGCNEDGLTLTRDAVSAVLRGYMAYFDPTFRYGKSPPSRLLTDAEAILQMVVSDANKEFIVGHDGAIDALVEGLMLDRTNPRTRQDGAEELQQKCALILQNLALSPIGAGPLRANFGAMQALSTLKSNGMTEVARQSASGALFELDETRRAGIVPNSIPIEHIMLSYNWDHQAVIKRVHASLVRRGYTTWIDIEKMQGSTVEA